MQEADVLVISKSLEETLSPLYKQSADVISQLRDLFERYNRYRFLVFSNFIKYLVLIGDL